MDAVAEVKARLNIEDVISEYVQLKRSGRNFKGISPWTNEKTASFMVSPEKQIWHDFSSGRGGDMFSFVMEAEGLDFKSALEMLARKAGVDLDQFRGSQNGQTRQVKARSLEILELATRFYQKQLTVNQTALKYLLRERGFSKKTLLTWQLGYSPRTGHALTDFLTKKGFTTDETKRAGVTVLRTDRGVDMFRGRIMIPLANGQGSVIGFTARLLDDEPDSPKYINTPQSAVYDKSRHVYGLHLAKETIRKSGFVVIVEGNLDVISSHQAGVTNVVATAGTAMTENHLRELKRFANDIRLCFDADSAGVAATERAIALAQKAGVSLGMIELKDAKDPDELARKDPAAWQKAIQKPTYAMDWLLNRYSSDLDLQSAQGKKAFSDALLPTIKQLSDTVEQEHYLKKVAELTDTTLEAMRSKFSGQAGASTSRQRAVKPPAENTPQQDIEYQRLKDHFLAIMLYNPKLRSLIKDYPAEYFTDEPSLELLNFLKNNPEIKMTEDLIGSTRLDEAQGAVENRKGNVQDGTLTADRRSQRGDSPKTSTAQAAKPAGASKWRVDPDYVKIITLQYEELYEGLPEDEKGEQASQLKSRLTNRYVKIQKQNLVAQMQATSDEKLLRQLMKKADKLNELIK